MIVRTPPARSSTTHRHAAIGAALFALALVGCSESARWRGEAVGTRLAASAHPAPGRSPAAGEPARVRPALELLDTHESGVFNRGAAEVVDYHPATRRAFVVNSSAARVSVLELGPRGFRPSERTLEPARDIAEFNAGAVTSVAVGRDVVAVAVCARSNDARGRVAFYGAVDLRYLGALTVGYVPDMLTFTPDGRRVLVANEGEQVRSRAGRIVADPEGSVSIIDVSRGVEQARVAAVRFDGFDARIEEYRKAGVRIPHLADGFFEAGEGDVKLSTDLEPEYIAVAPDGKTAWVSLQENDAVAVLDVAAARFTEIVPLGVKDFSRGTPTLERVVGRSSPDSSGTLEAEPQGFWLSSDESRGERQTFYVLRERAIQRVEVDGSRSHEADPILLVSPRERSLAGELEGKRSGASERRYRGLARDPRDRSFWLGDAERPWLHRFADDGRLMQSLALRAERPPVRGPAGRAADRERQREPSVAGLTLDAQRHRLYVLLRGVSPAGPDPVARIVVIDAEEGNPDFGQTLAEYQYQVDRRIEGEEESSGPLAEILGVALEPSGRLLVLEGRGTGARRAAPYVYRVDLSGASNLLDRSAMGADVEADGADDLSVGYGLEPARKQKLFAVSSLTGVDSTRVRDLALLGDGRLVFAMGAPETPAEGAGRAFAVVSFDDQNRLDVSDRDGRVQLRHWPVLGGYMPDGIEALRAGGTDYFVTANEGDTRDYDAKRLADVDLDPIRFPDAALLQARSSLGRLKISALDGDIDADGDFDEIHTFGARSLSIWDRSGNQVFDTGSLLEEVTAAALAGSFNSNNDENGSFDTRSDDKGPEPEGLEIAEIDGRAYAFVGLERVGGIVVLDVTDPHAVGFVEYVNPRDFTGSAAAGSARDLGPEGLKFVPAALSPTGRGLLLVANEVSGTTTAYDVNL